MKRSLDRKRVKFYLWVGLGYFFLGVVTIAGKYPGQFLSVIFNNIWALAFVIPVNFLLFEFSVPFVLRKRRTVFYNIFLAILLLWLYLMAYSIGAYAWKLFGIALHVYTRLKVFPNTGYAIENQMGYSMGSVFLFGILWHIYNYIKLKQEAQQFRIEKQEAELNYLKSQTNPHFLFNTLNNIYSLAKDKSDLAPQSILQLSKILRFMLYETAGEFIPVEKELKIISDYVALEKLRYDESLRINFNYDVEDMKQAIPPLLLIPLVENAFKHGASETTRDPFVDIHLSLEDRRLNFVVKNSIDDSVEGNEIKESIGLSNLRRQLELLYKEHELSVRRDLRTFTAHLKINLASHV
ncbi:MAG TPA: histidine kinase [Chitinophagaceae bacterium]|nr:histidine kinase [Chitinophagaceae bacterium]